MKLAVALSRRAELQTRLRQLESRLSANALVQEGEEPAEDPKDLLTELEENYTALEALIAAINRTSLTPACRANHIFYVVSIKSTVQFVCWMDSSNSRSCLEYWSTSFCSSRTLMVLLIFISLAP